MNRKTQLTLGRYDEDKFQLSTIPSTKEDVKQLEDYFNLMLYKEYALENGLCSKRRQIYDDLFNELIRIIKIHCYERGLLFEKIQNEYKQWMNIYEELYSSSMGYSIRQYLYKIEEKKSLELKINKLENDCQQLRVEIKNESIKFEKLTKEIHSNNQQFNDLYKNVQILRSLNKKFHRDLEKTLNHILTSSIFLGEPINYETE